MATKPSIRGRIFAPAVEDVRKLLSSGALHERELVRWLQAPDLPLLRTEMMDTEWYDVKSYARMLTLLRDVAGGGNDDYLRERGMSSAQRLLDAGLYQQLEYLSRLQKNDARTPEERYEAYGRDLKLLTTISAAILSFSRWAAKPDPERALCYRLEITEATDFPRELMLTSEGFANRMAKQHGDPDLFRAERVAPDVIWMRMIRAL